MSRFSKGIALVALLTAGAIALAVDTPTQPRPARSPMVAELLQLNATGAKQLESLREQFQAAPDEESAVAIQRRIEALQLSTESQLLAVQLRYAREEDRLDDIRQLEGALSVLRSNLSDFE